ncbi:PleD family two-component system response regulator [uncultured Chloroflexus sp.]|uniref:response regulator n=1 Tax=uncultured Chloroflexus sp. TaxID=214040 RepID=UPI00262187E8|nr:response regulator [uncultured Chloroflexus sp.]
MTTPDILLIEDSPSQALQFRLMLEQAGYRVEVAVTSLEGWRAASVLKPRMILLDIDLPGLDGFQVLSRLKRDRATRHIPVVMLTHREHVSSVQRAIDLGANDYLFKDDAVSALLPVVEQVIALA